MLVHLHIRNHDIRNVAEQPVDLENAGQQQNSLQHQRVQQCPFASIRKVAAGHTKELRAGPATLSVTLS